MKKKRFISFVLCVLLVIGLVGIRQEKKTEAAVTLSLKQAKSLALANSTKYSKLQSKVALKQVAYSSAVKALKLKIKHKTTLTWSPLLSFHLPEQLTLGEESEGRLKPVFLTNEIREIKHELNDTVYSTYEKISNLYVEAYSLQEAIAFETEQLVLLNETLVKNKARLALNLAKKKDIDSIEASIKKVESSLAGDTRKFEQKKSKISDLIGMDISTGYKFSNPFITANIPRSKLKDLTEYTLNNDHEFYKTKMTTAEALMTLNTNYSLMSGHYGWKMGYINKYITSIKNGQKVDTNAFKRDFDTFVYKIDEPWYGKKRILFVKISKEWFKGNIDGVRYVEDDPYVLYSNALDYQDARKDQAQAEVDLRAQVKDSFENIVTARNAYLAVKDSVAEQKKLLDNLLIQNALGEVTFEEYTDAQNFYDELQKSLRESLEMYSTLLYSFDRLTCGAVSAYFQGQGLSSDHAEGGTSFIIEQEAGTDAAMYYITPIITDNLFEFGISIPKDFDTDISDFALYINGYPIGNKTPVSKTLRHLAFALDDTPKAFVRLYSGEEVIADCEIDASQYQGTLTIPGSFVVKDARETIQIGTYVTQTNASDLLEVIFTFEPVEKIAYYSLVASDGKTVLTETPIAASDPFVYLQLLAGSLDEMVIKCFDSEKNLLYDAYFNSSRNTVYKKNVQ